MQILSIKPSVRKIILPAIIAGSGLAVTTTAVNNDKSDKVIEYMTNSPATQSAALFGLFGLFGKKKEENIPESKTVNLEAQIAEQKRNETAQHFDQQYEQLKQELFYPGYFSGEKNVNIQIDKFINELEQASVNKDSFQIVKQVFDYIKTNIAEDKHKVVTSNTACNVYFLDKGLELILPNLICDCVSPFEEKDWMKDYFEALNDKELYPHAKNNILPNILNNRTESLANPNDYINKIDYLKNDIYYNNAGSKELDQFLDELEKVSSNKEAFQHMKQAVDYIKEGIRENKRSVLSSDSACTVHFKDVGLEFVVPRLINDCITPYEDRDWLKKGLEFTERRYPSYKADNAKNIFEM